MRDDFFETSMKFLVVVFCALIVGFLCWFIPVQSYQAYTDAVACKKSGGLYDCTRKETVRTDNINFHSN